MKLTVTTPNRWAPIILLAFLAAACGGSDSDDVVESGGAADETVAPAADDADQAGDPTDESDPDDDAPASDEVTAEPEVDTGTVTLGGETSELVGPSRSDLIVLEPDEDNTGTQFDFEICETINPAFAGDFNIGGTLADGTRFWLTGNVDEAFDDNDGFVLGELPDEERAENTSVSLDGRTLSGTATTSRGEAAFTFTC